MGNLLNAKSQEAFIGKVNSSPNFKQAKSVVYVPKPSSPREKNPRMKADSQQNGVEVELGGCNLDDNSKNDYFGASKTPRESAFARRRLHSVIAEKAMQVSLSFKQGNRTRGICGIKTLHPYESFRKRWDIIIGFALMWSFGAYLTAYASSGLLKTRGNPTF